MFTLRRTAVARLGLRPALGLALALAAALGAPVRPARAAQACAAPGPFPGDDWTSVADELRRARPAEVAALDAYAFTLTGADAERKGHRTDGLVVVHRGLVTYERYGRGFTAATPHLAWSATKTLTQALVGVAVTRGALAVDDSICKHLRDAPPAHCDITVRRLMESASGLDWSESYEGLGLQRSSVLAMLYGEGRRDMAAFALSHGKRAAPGARWNYSSGDAVVLAAVVERAMRAAGAGPGDTWLHDLLLGPLGVRTATLERDAAGTPVGSSYFYATPRDLARLGWLYANDGCWRGQAVLPDGWVRAATQVNAPFRGPGGWRRLAGGSYGWDLWLNRPVPELGWTTLPWPGAPEDAFAARGHWGQEIIVVPSQQLVVVRTADDRGEKLSPGRLVELALAAGRAP